MHNSLENLSDLIEITLETSKAGYDSNGFLVINEKMQILTITLKAAISETTYKIHLH